MQYAKLNDIKPADYNPRVITDDKFKQLMDSIRQNGFCIPVLVNKSNNVIIAGHQRTKAAKALGMESIPVIYISNITKSDEVLFNQIHNGCDNEQNAKATILKRHPTGFSQASCDDFNIVGYNAQIVKETCHLLLKYGNCLMAVIADGEMVLGKNYAYACKLLNMPVNISVIESDGELLKEKYGDYSYRHLKKNTWVQGLAQMSRLPLGKSKKAKKSCLYEQMVIPRFLRDGTATLLDFGCGRGEYVNRLPQNRAIGVEFYNHNTRSINVSKGNCQINALIEHISTKGLFDIVVCDSVLNSVDSTEAEKSVVLSTWAMLKDKGTLFISGRCVDSLDSLANLNYDRATMKRHMWFLDKENFTAMFRRGQWFYQKFHNKQQAIELIENNGFSVVKYTSNGMSWQIEAVKTKTVERDDIKKAIDFEFDLPLPDGRSYKRNNEVMQALAKIYNAKEV